MKIDAAYVTTNNLPLKASPFLFTNSPTTDSVVGSYTFSLPANTRGIRLVSVVEEFVSGPDGSGYSQTVGDSFKFIDGVAHSTEVMSWEQMYKLATDQVVDLGSNVGCNNVFFGDSGLVASSLWPFFRWLICFVYHSKEQTRKNASNDECVRRCQWRCHFHRSHVCEVC